ncbi:MAG: hypothetical protein KDA46_13530, partial [Parvularculaceae bacterium]|nr:hypothetical protein [Parvularculaceae bacterium]
PYFPYTTQWCKHVRTAALAGGIREVIRVFHKSLVNLLNKTMIGHAQGRGMDFCFAAASTT